MQSNGTTNTKVSVIIRVDNAISSFGVATAKYVIID